MFAIIGSRNERPKKLCEYRKFVALPGKGAEITSSGWCSRVYRLTSTGDYAEGSEKRKPSDGCVVTSFQDF